MQSIQTKTAPTGLPSEYGYLNCPFSTVDEFLHHCHLDQYLDIFISEGFDSITSLLEITEEDMTIMNVKRGHRRLIQREIATIKGVSRDQPLITNMLNAKYHDMLPNANLKMEEQCRSNPNLNSNTSFNNPSLSSYDVIGLTSPRSMNSGIGSSTSGTSSSSGPMTNLRTSNNSSSSSNNNNNDPSTLIHPYHHHHYHRKSNNPPNPSSATMNKMSSNSNTSNTIEVRSSSNSSNDDNDSVDTNESVPTKRKYRRHAKPDRHAPVKPPSAYIMFSNDARAELKHQNLSFADMAKIVGDQWKNLSHAKKQHYERMAMRAKDEYLAALEQYRQTPQYQQYKNYLDDFKQKQQEANSRLMMGRARKRPKQQQLSPGSGSIADSSSNGNSTNGNGSSGSGSTDTYGDKESVLRRQQQQRPSASDSGYTSQQSYFRPNYNDAVMRGVLPIEFVQNITPQPVNKKHQQSSDDLDEEDEVSDTSPTLYKRRSPRFATRND